MQTVWPGQRTSRHLAIFLLLGALLTIGISCWQWKQHAALYQIDLMNRVVGARLQQYGISPYFYSWQPGEAEFFRDPFRVEGPISNSTATPFYHRMMQLLSHHSMAWISVFHFYSHYFAAGTVILLLAFFSRRWWYATTGAWVMAAFTFTKWWKLLLLFGQYYLLFPLLLLLSWVMANSLSRWVQWLALLPCAVLILCKPTAVLWALPWLAFQQQRFWRGFALLILIVAGVHLSGDKAAGWKYWEDYRRAAALHGERNLEKMRHRSLALSSQTEDQLPKGVPVLWLAPISQALTEAHALAETSGLYRFLYMVSPALVNQPTLMAAAAVFFLCLATLVWWQHKRLLSEQVLLAGAVALVISDFFLPVYRSGYFGVQWVGPILLAIRVAWQTRRQRYLWILPIWFGFLYWRPLWIPMRVTLAEGLMALFLLALALWPAKDEVNNPRGCHKQ